MTEANAGPVFVVVDVEASGPSLSVHGLLEIGATLADDLDQTFQCYVRPEPGTKVDPWVRDHIPGVLRAARERGIPLEEAASRFRTWIRGHAGDRPAVMVGYILGLDWRAICDLFERGLGPEENPFHYKALDIYPLAMGALGLPWGFSREQLDGWIGLTPQSEEELHNALFDALQHAREFNALRRVLGPRWKIVAGAPGGA